MQGGQCGSVLTTLQRGVVVIREVIVYLCLFCFYSFSFYLFFFVSLFLVSEQTFPSIHFSSLFF